MANDVTIVFKVKDQTKKAISGIKSNLAGLGSNLSTAGKYSLVGVTAGLGAVGYAGYKAGKALGQMAIDAAPAVQIGDAFASINKDMGKSSEQMLTALQKSSAGMVDNTTLMKNYNLAAQLVSKEFATSLPDAMGYLTKVSAATGESMDYMMNSLVRGIGRTSPMILDNLGIQVDLAEVTERAAEKFGVQADELSKAQLQSELTAVVMEKLKENTEGIPDATDSAAASFARWQAFIKNSKDEIGVKLLPVLQKFIEKLLPIGERLLPVILGLMDKLTPVIDTIATAFTEFVTSIMDGEGIFESFTELIRNLGFEELATWIETVKAKLDELWAIIEPYIQPILEWAMNFVTLKDALIGISIAIMAFVIPSIVSLLSNIAPIIGVVLLVIGIVALLRNAWENDWGGIQEKTRAVMDFIKNIIQTVLDTIQGFWDEHGAQIMGTVQSLWDGVIAVFEWFKGIWEEITELFHLAQEGNWEEFGEKLRELIVTILEDIGKAILDAHEAIGEAFGELFRWAIQVVKDIDWLQLGKDIIHGIADGMMNAQLFLFETVRNIISASADVIKGFFGIKSPSKLMAGFGSDIVKGLIVGMEQENANLLRSFDRVANVTFNGMERNTTGELVNAINGLSRELATRQTYTINANYEYRNESDLISDIRLLQTLSY